MDWVYGEVWWQLGDFYYNPKHGLIGKSQTAFISSHFEVGTGMMMDPCQSEQKVFLVFFFFSTFLVLSSQLCLHACCCFMWKGGVFTANKPCVWTSVIWRSCRARSKLTLLLGEPKVWKNIWVFPKKYGNPSKSSIFIGFSIINHPFLGTPIFGKTLFHLWVFGSTLEWSKGVSKIGKSYRWGRKKESFFGEAGQKNTPPPKKKNISNEWQCAGTFTNQDDS